MTKKTKVASFGLISMIISVAAIVLYFSYQLFKSPVSTNAAEIIFDVSPGTSLAQIANDLEAKGLVRNSKAFQFYAKIKGLSAKFKVGEYSLNAALSPDEIMSTLVSGKSIARSITIAEGLNLFDIAEIFEKNNVGTKEEFKKLVHDKFFIKSLLGQELNSLEGYLFPETYKVTKFEGTKSVLTQMVNRFLTVWKEIEPQIGNNITNRNELMVLASIIEKETGAAFERPVISSVFHNRLIKKMRLQTDPAVMYGVALKLGKMPTNITKSDLLNPTVYNSYTNAGLPPTPIANPGKESILAAAQPAHTKYLFFVSQNNGTHIFSENIQQHNKAVREFQLNAKARENKSWRDLKQPAK